MTKGKVVKIMEGEHKGKMGVVIETPHGGYKTIRVVINHHEEVDIPDNYLEYYD